MRWPVTCRAKFTLAGAKIFINYLLPDEWDLGPRLSTLGPIRCPISCEYGAGLFLRGQTTTRAATGIPPQVCGRPPNTHRPSGRSRLDRRASIQRHAPYRAAPLGNGPNGIGPIPCCPRYNRYRGFDELRDQSCPAPRPDCCAVRSGNSPSNSKPAADLDLT